VNDLFLQAIMTIELRYYSGKRQDYGTPRLSSGWGGFTFFIEIDDQHVTRQVNQFDNGTVLRYDRDHWCDGFGSMFVGTFSRKQKAARYMVPLSRKEFERVWKQALANSIWDEQKTHAMMHEWGTWQERVRI
jgi:hypothetical protein